ncbi:ankyrin repeat domain-containing protein [Candidatus Berkiella cookevillensis]|uniref:Ankyrin repeat domain-containing protein n=2 Tax=Candidatus Berkiella cookevillensis TaxID=437022 RepID=A0A0Q9YR64_9GAMM|nr:ankyrin repeat domain-containing protein [Candidatus Berkiella cookevillensis]
MNRLLEFPAVAREVANNKNSALLWAAHSGHFDIVKRFLEFPEVADEITSWYNDALRLADNNRHLDIVELLQKFNIERAAVSEESLKNY